MALPNFLVIGAMRGGTTALCDFLGQHPEVFVCDPKEPHFFAFEGQRPAFAGPPDEDLLNSRAVTTAEDYQALFHESGQCTAIGEGSVTSLYSPRAAEGIRRRIPEARLIAILRDPAERAYSAFGLMLAKAFEPENDFRRALELEEERIAANWGPYYHYRAMGLYSEQLTRFLRRFDREQVLVLEFEEFQQNKTEHLRLLFDFLGVAPDFAPQTSAPIHLGGRPRSRRLSRIMDRPGALKSALGPLLPRGLRLRLRRWNLSRPTLDAELRAELYEGFKDDIRRTEDLLGRDLSNWHHR